MNLIEDVRQGLDRLDNSLQELKKFSLIMSLLFTVLSTLIFFFSDEYQTAFWLLGIVCFFLICAFFMPRTIKPVRILWIGFSLVLGYFMSRILLSLVYFLVISPIRLIMTILGRDLLNTKLDPQIQTYWIYRATKEKSPSAYEKMF